MLQWCTRLNSVLNFVANMLLLVIKRFQEALLHVKHPCVSAQCWAWVLLLESCRSTSLFREFDSFGWQRAIFCERKTFLIESYVSVRMFFPFIFTDALAVACESRLSTCTWVISLIQTIYILYNSIDIYIYTQYNCANKLNTFSNMSCWIFCTGVLQQQT